MTLREAAKMRERREREIKESTEILNTLSKSSITGGCYSLNQRNLVPSEKGVYILINKNHIVYVGQCKDMRSRMSGHCGYKKKQFLPLISIKNLF